MKKSLCVSLLVLALNLLFCIAAHAANALAQPGVYLQPEKGPRVQVHVIRENVDRTLVQLVHAVNNPEPGIVQRSYCYLGEIFGKCNAEINYASVTDYGPNGVLKNYERLRNVHFNEFLVQGNGQELRVLMPNTRPGTADVQLQEQFSGNYRLATQNMMTADLAIYLCEDRGSQIIGHWFRPQNTNYNYEVTWVTPDSKIHTREVRMLAASGQTYYVKVFDAAFELQGCLVVTETGLYEDKGTELRFIFAQG